MTPMRISFRVRSPCGAVPVTDSFVESTIDEGVLSSIEPFPLADRSGAAWNTNDCLQAAASNVFQTQIAPVCLGDIARNTQSKTDPAGGLAAGAFHTIVGFQHALEEFLRYARTIILDPEDDILRLFLHFEPCL